MTDAALARGARGPAVRALQVRLSAHGFGRLTATGEFDAGTEAAVRTAQRDLGLAVDGVAGPPLLAALGAAPCPTALALTGWGAL